jgi:hypothetical protein
MSSICLRYKHLLDGSTEKWLPNPNTLTTVYKHISSQWQYRGTYVITNVEDGYNTVTINKIRCSDNKLGRPTILTLTNKKNDHSLNEYTINGSRVSDLYKLDVGKYF